MGTIRARWSWSPGQGRRLDEKHLQHSERLGGRLSKRPFRTAGRAVLRGNPMAKAPKKPTKPPEPAPRSKRSTGLLTGTANVQVRVEVKITDKFYELDLLADDIRHKRVWFEPPA